MFLVIALIVALFLPTSYAWFFSLFGMCPLNCPTPPPPPPPSIQFQNAYPTAPQIYLPAAYPVAPQMAIPPNAYAVPPPSYVVAPQQYVYATPPPTYATPPPTYPTPPPPRCFQNSHGYKCCSKDLDMFLDDMVMEIQTSKWTGCNLQRFATQIQFRAQSKFNHSMESIVSSGNLENLSHYRGDLYCKKRTANGKVVLIYGTAVPYSLESGETRPMTPQEIAMRMYPREYNDIGLHNGKEDNIQF